MLVSIIIATYNSERTLTKVLKSIRKQSMNKRDYEVLIVDGGSVDKTKKIARSFGCRIIDNPYKEPISGKCIGFNKAKGDYVIYLDSDEVMYNKNSVKNKLKFIKKNKLKAVIGSGYKDPENANFIIKYTNEYGDPFSYFIYNLSKKYPLFIQELKNKYKVEKEDKIGFVMDFSTSDQIPLIETGAANTMVSVDFFNKEFGGLNKRVFALHFYYLCERNEKIGVSKHDPVIHYASISLLEYFKKLEWRVKNNIHHQQKMGVYGFKGRDEFQKGILKLKKYFFLPYAFLLFPLLFDTMLLVFRRKDISYILHFPLTLFTATLIVYHFILKLMNIKPAISIYGSNKKISRKISDEI